MKRLSSLFLMLSLSLSSYLPLSLFSLTCCVSSGTDSDRYDCDPRAVRGANPTMKKWRRGKGMRLTASLRRSELS
jgi:hypothetical protein